MARNRVEVIIDGQDNLSGVINGITSGFGKTGKAMSMGVTAPILAMGGAIATMAGNFEAAMNNVQAISGASGDQLMRLRDQAKQLGIQTQFSATEAAEAQALLAQAGFSTDQIIGAMPATLNMAAAGNLKLAESADIASSVLTGFQLDISQLPDAVDTLAFAANSTNTDIRELGVAMRYVAPVAAGMRQGFEQSTLALGLLSNAGIKGSMAGTTLRGILTKLSAPSAKAAGILNDLGISVYDTSGQMRPLVEIMKQFEGSSATAADYMQIFGQRAGPGMMALLSQGSGALEELIAKEKAAGNVAQDMAEIQMQGLNGAIKGMTSAFEGLAIAIGESGFLEFLAKGVTAITTVVRYLAALDPAILRTVTIIAAIAAAIGPALIAMGVLAASITAITTAFAAGGALAGVGAAIGGAFAAIAAVGAGPILLAIAGIAAGAYLIINNWGAVSGFFQGLWANLQSGFAQVQAFVGGFITGFRNNLLSSGIAPALVNMALSFQQIWQAVQPLGVAIASMVGGLMNVGMAISNLVASVFPIQQVGNAFRSTGVSAYTFGYQAAAAVAAVIGALARASAGVARFAAAFVTAKAQALAELASLAASAFNAGAQIIQRLAAGIRSQVGAIASAMGGIANQVRSFLPGSPVKEGVLRVFNRAQSSPGATLMRMLGAGIESVNLASYMGNAVSPLASPFSGSPATPPTTGAAPALPAPQGAIAPNQGNNITFANSFTIVAAPGQNVEELGQQILQFLEAQFSDYEQGFLT